MTLFVALGGAAAGAPTFESDVRPLLRAKCLRCHGEEARKGDLDLRTTAGIRQGGESGPVLTPAKPEDSKLFTAIRDHDMPPKKPLGAADIDLVRRWILAGAPFADPAMPAAPALTQHDVIPVLLLRCAACHGRQQQKGGLDVRTRASLLAGGKHGPAIVPGHPEKSLILEKIHAGEMPPRKQLVEVSVKPAEPAEIEKLRRWIALGAPEIPDEPDPSGTPADPLVTDRDRAFWAFQPPRRPALPAPREDLSARARNPIDAFILTGLQARGLEPVPEADRTTLLRRASLDLTGLPSTPAEVRAFLADTAPDAYERLVERLLASPRYGERWGRHWLDVAGYADSEGKREQHLPRPFAYRYRDYVIRAFNDDKPYDRFLIEQLAGDELADHAQASELTPALYDDLVATGFLRMAPDPTWAEITAFVPDRLEVIADELDVVGSGIMGLTLKCARCHSHKFDPIPQRDYYRFKAIFAGAYDEHDWLKPSTERFEGVGGLGGKDRTLERVPAAELKKWQAESDAIESEIAWVKTNPRSTETNRQLAELNARRLPRPRIAALWDRGDPSPTYLYRRGDYLNPGLPVPPGVPAVLPGAAGFAAARPWSGATATGRRLAFARWLTRPDHPLTARVMVNRIWKHHFGAGIVRSLGNFGKTGDRPSHPELLDWLATELVRGGWSVKAIHRLIMTSSTYRQSSTVTPEVAERDPDNRLLGRMPLRRMEAEVLRDTLLYVAGQLDETRFGPADPVEVREGGLVVSGHRRSIYIQQLRKHPATLLESFDMPPMAPNCLVRAESQVATQALNLLNDASVRNLARAAAGRVLGEAPPGASARLDLAFLTLIGRLPAPAEKKLALSTFEELRHDGASAPEAMAEICHTLMNSAAFIYID